MEALREYKRYTYAGYCAWSGDRAAVHVLKGCAIDIGDVFGE